MIKRKTVLRILAGMAAAAVTARLGYVEFVALPDAYDKTTSLANKSAKALTDLNDVVLKQREQMLSQLNLIIDQRELMKKQQRDIGLYRDAALSAQTAARLMLQQDSLNTVTLETIGKLYGDKITCPQPDGTQSEFKISEMMRDSRIKQAFVAACS